MAKSLRSISPLNPRDGEGIKAITRTGGEATIIKWDKTVGSRSTNLDQNQFVAYKQAKSLAAPINGGRWKEARKTLEEAGFEVFSTRGELQDAPLPRTFTIMPLLTVVVAELIEKNKLDFWTHSVRKAGALESAAGFILIMQEHDYEDVSRNHRRRQHWGWSAQGECFTWIADEDEGAKSGAVGAMTRQQEGDMSPSNLTKILSRFSY